MTKLTINEVVKEVLDQVNFTNKYTIEATKNLIVAQFDLSFAQRVGNEKIIEQETKNFDRAMKIFKGWTNSAERDQVVNALSSTIKTVKSI